MTRESESPLGDVLKSKFLKRKTLEKPQFLDPFHVKYNNYKVKLSINYSN